MTPPPAKMTINQSYLELTTVKSKSLYSKKRPVNISLPSTSFDDKKNKQAFMPNFIHSMDAANVQLLVNTLIDKYINNNENINLFTIHDCFATTPNSMSIIDNELRIAFIKMYFSYDFLETLHNDFLKQITSFTKVFTKKTKKRNGDIIHKEFVLDKNNKKTNIFQLSLKQLIGIIIKIFVKILINHYILLIKLLYIL
jgi:DNA-directed RNA polymerase